MTLPGPSSCDKEPACVAVPHLPFARQRFGVGPRVQKTRTVLPSRVAIGSTGVMTAPFIGLAAGILGENPAPLLIVRYGGIRE